VEIISSKLLFASQWCDYRINFKRSGPDIHSASLYESKGFNGVKNWWRRVTKLRKFTAFQLSWDKLTLNMNSLISAAAKNICFECWNRGTL